ncbi:hypothetical protein BDV26DRAFT_65664 [Aspergillus bertholletiae]|uniref:Uncharacterized protein n=1 Tax=Aspergillus bertholletiae TaxID=1226010 RepID=A0A5N7BJ44_9EURO|nr:hypothetical protein BDV26DRAFT_65664 [Aspergillus bertholletiae]
MWSPEPSVRQKTRDNVRVNVRVVKALSQYWKFAALYERYLRYLYKVHAESSTLLEDEPRSIDPAKLTGGRFSAPDANTTILGFNRILWMKCGAYAGNGEEPTELDGTKQKEVGQNYQPSQETPLFTKDHVEIFPSQVELQNPAPLSFAETVDAALDVSAVPPTQIHTEQLSASVYDADVNSFYPCEAEMVQLEAVFFDQMQPVMGLGSMGMFAGCDSFGNSETGGNPYSWS